jgi:two-component system response regulator TctD
VADRKVSLLLVEDSQPIAAAIQAFLQSLPTAPAVVHSASLQDARMEMDKQQFDMAVVDMQLPDGLGTELIVQLRSGAPGMEIVATSVDTRLGRRQDMLEAGADHFVSKPELHKVLMERLG